MCPRAVSAPPCSVLAPTIWTHPEQRLRHYRMLNSWGQLLVNRSEFTHGELGLNRLSSYWLPRFSGWERRLSGIG